MPALYRGGPEDRAMAEYIRSDRLPLAYGPMEERRGGHYVSRTRYSTGQIVDEAKIVLNENLRQAPVGFSCAACHRSRGAVL